MKNTLIVYLTVAASVSAFADTIAVGQANKLDLSPIIVANQSLPTLKVGADANKDNGILNVGVNNGVSVNLPFVAASATLGSVSVGPEKLNVSVGNNNSVTVGSVTLAQSLPTAQVGTRANKASWFDISLKNGLSVTLPLVSLSIPYPSLTTKPEAKK